MICLYKKGNTHEVRGIKCEIGRFPNSSLKSMIAQGWLLAPEDIETDKPETKVVTMTPDQVRAKAKDAGIEEWKTARIQTLLQKLGLC